MKKTTRLLSILSLMLTTTVLPTMAQTANDKNKAIIETWDGQQQMNTDEISVIRFEGDKITFVQPWGESVFDRTLRSLTFLRPNPGSLRLTANTTIEAEGGTNRSQSIDGDGNLITTWTSNDVVCRHADTQLQSGERTLCYFFRQHQCRPYRRTDTLLLYAGPCHVRPLSAGWQRRESVLLYGYRHCYHQWC